MLIIDFHTHCFPDALAPRAMETLTAHSCGIVPRFDGTIGGLTAVEHLDGCDGFVLLPIATNPRQTAAVNRFAAQIQDPARHIYAFGSVHPEDPDYLARLAEIKDYGLRGIKFHPEYQDFYADDERVFPVYDAIFSLGLPIVFHAGEDIGFAPPWHAEPYCIARVAKRFPGCTIIAAHLGGYRMWRQAAELLAPLPNVYMDVSFEAGNLPDEEFALACSRWRKDHIIFGSDEPWADAGAAREAVLRLPYTQTELEGIFAGNALRVMGVNK